MHGRCPIATWPKSYVFQIQARMQDSQNWSLVSESLNDEEADGFYRSLVVGDSYFKPVEVKLVKGVFDPTTNNFLPMYVVQFWSAE